jgi:predicted adenylyl cyclase CyaB
VADPAALREILRELGFRAVVAYEKRRAVWMLGACEIAMDELPQVGWFVEIEGPTVAEVDAVRDQLGLVGAAVEASTYVELAAAHGRPGASGVCELQFDKGD